MDELDEIINRKLEEKKAPIQNAPAPEQPKQAVTEARQVQNVTAPTAFSQAVEGVKMSMLNEAQNDERFSKDVTEQIKAATVKLAEVEKDKAELEQKNIQYEQELKDKQRQLNEFEKQQNYWKNRQDRRQYHYDGVKPIMEFVGIRSPMNLVLLYFLTCVITPFFLLAKLFKGTIGALIAGAEDSNRPKAMKGFIWTILGLLVAAMVAISILLALNWLGILHLRESNVTIPEANQVIEQIIDMPESVSGVTG